MMEARFANAMINKSLINISLSCKSDESDGKCFAVRVRDSTSEPHLLMIEF